jgi:hypothetical protein
MEMEQAQANPLERAITNALLHVLTRSLEAGHLDVAAAVARQLGVDGYAGASSRAKPLPPLVRHPLKER